MEFLFNPNSKCKKPEFNIKTHSSFIVFKSFTLVQTPCTTRDCTNWKPSLLLASTAGV